MLKKIKLLTLRLFKASGMFALVARSQWRRNRLLILGYHGISQQDEHFWNPELYMPPCFFRERMNSLKLFGCNVLPLDEAIERLHAGTLPEKSVVLTFDDGLYDFYTQAYPIIKEHNFPVTVYLTTYYSRYNKPVFDVISAYILWKGRNATLDGAQLIGVDRTFDLSNDAERMAAAKEVRMYAEREQLSAVEKDTLAAQLARHLNVDYEVILDKRILHLLTPEEVAQLAAQGVDVQLHTHRHRTPLDKQLFLREIESNRCAIVEATTATAADFCYPNGIYKPQFLPWLEEVSVATATTCDPGLTARGSNKLLLPRLMDTALLSQIEFEGWLSGVSSFLPRRPMHMNGAT